jgi:hypothetical protein
MGRFAGSTEMSSQYWYSFQCLWKNTAHAGAEEVSLRLSQLLLWVGKASPWDPQLRRGGRPL